MSNTIYTSVTYQTALLDEMTTIASNIANASTPGYRTERLVFSEFVKETEDKLGSVSMATARVRYANASQGDFMLTNGTFDMAIEGEGFFQIQTPDGVRLTRNGSFTPSPENTLVNADGNALLGEGGAAVFVPPDAAQIEIAADGSISADGEPVGRIDLVTADPNTLQREASMMFAPQAEVLPVENPRIAQGFLEGSNVNTIQEIARMIDVQRAYEMSLSMMEEEHNRIQSNLQTTGEAV